MKHVLPSTSRAIYNRAKIKQPGDEKMAGRLSRSLLACARMADKHWYIKNCDLFELLSTEQLASLEARSRIRSFAKGSPIYLPSDAANGVMLLAEGRAKLCGYTPDGKQSILAFIEPGEIFGELAILDPGGSREEYAEAVVASSVVLMPADGIERLMSELPHLALGVTKLIGLRRRRIERRLKYLLFRSNRDRLIHLLLELAEQYGRRTATGVEITLKLAHQDLANIIGSTRETVTVLLGGLQLEGYLRVKRQHIEIRDLPRLAACADAIRLSQDRLAILKSDSSMPPKPAIKRGT